MPTGSLQFGLFGLLGEDGPVFHYALTTASAERQGLYLTPETGSPHFSMEPVSGSPSTVFAGDLWFESSGSSGDGNLHLGETDLESGLVIIKRVVTAREGETIVQAINRYTSSDAPSDTFIAASAVISDDFFLTANSPNYSGSLVRNAEWDAGVYMPDQDTVAVYGSDKDFLVPSGSLTLERGNELIQSGSLTIYTGSISLQGDFSQFIISGSSVTASLLNNPMVSVLSGSVETSSLSPTPIDGTMYVKTDTEQVYIKAGGLFYPIEGDVPDTIDGGTY